MSDVGALASTKVAEAPIQPMLDAGPRGPRPRRRLSPANIVLYDPAHTRMIDGAQMTSMSSNTPYAGRELPGRIVATFLRGRATVLDGELQEGSA